MKHIKIYAAVVFFVLSSICFAGCDSLPTADLTRGESVTNEATNDEAGDVIKTEPFEMEHIGVSTDYGFDYYRDTITDVIYIRYREQAINEGMGGLTVMLDASTGLPLTYARYLELYNNISNDYE